MDEMEKKLEEIKEATSIRIKGISVSECCMALSGIKAFLTGFAGYVTEHAGEQQCDIAVGLVCERMTAFLGAEKKLRDALKENVDKIFSSFAPLPGSPIDMLNILMKEGKINPNKS